MINAGRCRMSLMNAACRAAAALCLCILAERGAQAPEGPPPASSPDHTGQPWAWQRQQPTRERTRELMEREGVALSPEERREQLRTLNEIHRELMPPGSTVPAPEVARNPERPGGRD